MVLQRGQIHIQINRTEVSPDIDPQIYCQLISNKDAKTIQCGNKSFQQMMLRELNSHIQKNEV